MWMTRSTILALLAGAVLMWGCENPRWDWWRKPKPAPEPAAYDDDLEEDPDEEFLDADLLEGGGTRKNGQAASRPATSQAASGPAGRQEWSKPRKRATSRRSRSRYKLGQSVENPVLFVNDDVISVQEVLDPLWTKLEKAAKEMSRGEYVNLRRTELQRRVVLLIDQVLAYGEAKKEIPDEMEPAITKAVDETEQNRINAEFDGRFSRYQAYLEEHSQDREDIRRRIRREIVVRRYLTDKFLPLVRPPTRRQLLKYYQKHPEEFTEPLRMEMFLIDVPYWKFLEGGSAEDREALWPKLRGRRRIEARRAAVQHMERARQELTSGIPFEAVARSYSFGPNASKGGVWGPVTEGGLTGRWARAAKALFELEAGQLSDILRHDEGLLLIKAGKRFEKRVIPFLEAQPIIEEKLVKQQQKELEDDLLLKLRKKGTRGELIPFFKALYEAAPKHRDERPGATRPPIIR